MTSFGCKHLNGSETFAPYGEVVLNLQSENSTKVEESCVLRTFYHHSSQPVVEVDYCTTH